MDKFVFYFTVEEVNKILGAMGKQPYQDVVELINEIIKQYQDQLPHQEIVRNEDEKVKIEK